MNRQSTFWTFLVGFCVLTVSACCVLSTKFEEQTLGTTYTVGDTFTDNGMNFELVQFYWYNNNPSPNGRAEVSNMKRAGGTGLEIYMGNINLQFNLPNPVEHISFDVGHWGGNMNLKINGAPMENFNDLAYINGKVINGVTVTVLGAYNTPGKWELNGPITSFFIGGQEFGIDNICVK